MTDSVPFSVKWGKESFTLNCVIPGGVKGLKTELEEKTSVPHDRMKLMPKSKGLWKGVLKDDFDLSSIDWQAALAKNKGNPLQILLMGSAAKLTGPKTKTVFLEDLPPEEIAKVQEPSGLENLGNTCYLNSVVQCLRAVPQMRNGLKSLQPAQSSPQSLFLTSLRDTLQQLDRTSNPVAPSTFVRATKMSFPQFAQTARNGAPMQQDAEEFFSGLLTIAAAATSRDENIKAALPFSTDEELGGAHNMIDALFGLKMEETLTCDEFDPKLKNKGSAKDAASAEAKSDDDDKMEVDGPTEAPVKSSDLHRKLVCNIQGGADGSSQTNVNHIAEGIELSLHGKIEKRSEILGRNAMWTRTQRIARLPPIITVQFGRFYWKATPDSADHAGVKCKVMKPIAFNNILDVYEFCTDEIKAVLKKSRDKALKEEDDRINMKLKGSMEADKKPADGADDAKPAAAAAGEGEEADPELQAALAMSMQTEEEKLASIGPGLPAEFQGQYELFAVVTHKGRDADGGHYMAWVKASNPSGKAEKAEKIGDTDEDNEDWFVFDDDEVSPCKTEDVLKLKGGGDWHMSYLNFYRAKK
uniref:Ubiquitin carboxyl-terminal hydrolase n=1 Tax=Craspedostauros australis TaxID=1486917 RepID=A0A7R9ZQX1_9STRA|mmetsp:Transcript_6371/g.17349  ORF Transcript_6371/g.17349 Transcript_6371/m.17349 type:complete len:583 (+) Transcript_6371:157-1905(+)|eukprot:CAMPEP_0198128954 /NCGR_PEP_ID=MMETSP1442-20131203/50538_1 /TAXON_ID= /ORGANISM="Craspedostauros australis, Strain CCMP3328" /LENGTH=582 /DNA_ID=CAMNT_0043789227 /DNA_START=113 /DNA_END=1861 /DNA_ORIENTATION=+